MIGLLTGLCALTLTACASPTMPYVERSYPPNLLAPCPDLPSLEDGTAEAVLSSIVEVSELYYDCQAKHHALVEAVRGVK